MTDTERVLTGYRVQLDEATARLLHGHRLESPNLISPAIVTHYGVEYVVAWKDDNEYVHKALRKALRAAIKSAKAAEREAAQAVSLASNPTE